MVSCVRQWRWFLWTGCATLRQCFETFRGDWCNECHVLTRGEGEAAIKTHSYIPWESHNVSNDCVPGPGDWVSEVPRVPGDGDEAPGLQGVRPGVQRGVRDPVWAALQGDPSDDDSDDHDDVRSTSGVWWSTRPSVTPVMPTPRHVSRWGHHHMSPVSGGWLPWAGAGPDLLPRDGLSQDAAHQVPPDQDAEVHQGQDNNWFPDKMLQRAVSRLSVKFQWRSRLTSVSPSLSPPDPSPSSPRATAQPEQTEVMAMTRLTGAVTHQIISPPGVWPLDTPPLGASRTVTVRHQGAGDHTAASLGAGRSHPTVTRPPMEAQATECPGAGACWTPTACLEGAQSPVTGALQGAVWPTATQGALQGAATARPGVSPIVTGLR